MSHTFLKKSTSIIFVVLVFFGVCSPQLARTQEGADSSIPEFNQLCWKEAQCRDARKNINPSAKSDEGWINTEPPCIGDFGKCLPAGISRTEIAFGGKREFENVGVFIQQMYVYAVGVAGIIAAIMIIVAGLQWVASGGNSEVISGAKKRIGGSLVGLFIAYASYFILNTINPALVNLRLPQTFMIRPQYLMPQFCSAAPAATKFSKASEDSDQVGSPNLKPDFTNFLSYGNSQDLPAFYCGKRFFMENGGETTCFGDFCKKGNICVDDAYEGKSPKQKYFCAPGMLAGKITGDAGGYSGQVVNTNAVQKYNVMLFALCNKNDKSIEFVKGYDVKTAKAPHPYSIPIPKSSLESYCGGKDNIAGFYLGIEVVDKTSGLGPAGTPLTTGLADWFAVGQSASNSHDCSVNLSTLAYKIVMKSPPDCVNNSLLCSCSLLSRPGLASLMRDKEDFKKHLISLAELDKGYKCDLVINRSEFPAIGNEVIPPTGLVDILVPGVQVLKIFRNTALTFGKDDITSCMHNQK